MNNCRKLLTYQWISALCIAERTKRTTELNAQSLRIAIAFLGLHT